MRGHITINRQLQILGLSLQASRTTLKYLENREDRKAQNPVLAEKLILAARFLELAATKQDHLLKEHSAKIAGEDLSAIADDIAGSAQFYVTITRLQPIVAGKLKESTVLNHTETLNAIIAHSSDAATRANNIAKSLKISFPKPDFMTESLTHRDRTELAGLGCEVTFTNSDRIGVLEVMASARRTQDETAEEVENPAAQVINETPTDAAELENPIADAEPGLAKQNLQLLQIQSPLAYLWQQHRTPIFLLITGGLITAGVLHEKWTPSVEHLFESFQHVTNTTPLEAGLFFAFSAITIVLACAAINKIVKNCKVISNLKAQSLELATTVAEIDGFPTTRIS